jgi:hypothetical protein
MASRDFDQFLRRQQAEASASAAFDWERERGEWLARLDELYEAIESLLDKYLSSGQIRLEYKTIELNEQNVGSYDAREMILKIGRQDVTLRPIGTLLIGFKGRVDVEGPAGRRQIALVDSKASGLSDLVHVSVVDAPKRPQLTRKLPTSEEKISEVKGVLDGKKIEWAWRIISPPPERRFLEITQESLFELIMDVASV